LNILINRCRTSLMKCTTYI